MFLKTNSRFGQAQSWGGQNGERDPNFAEEGPGKEPQGRLPKPHGEGPHPGQGPEALGEGWAVPVHELPWDSVLSPTLVCPHTVAAAPLLGTDTTRLAEFVYRPALTCAQRPPSMPTQRRAPGAVGARWGRIGDVAPRVSK